MIAQHESAVPELPLHGLDQVQVFALGIAHLTQNLTLLCKIRLKHLELTLNPPDLPVGFCQAVPAPLILLNFLDEEEDQLVSLHALELFIE